MSAHPSASSTPAQPPSVGWAAGALVLTASIGIVAKIAGVLVAPGVRGVASQETVDFVENGSAALAYTFAALLVGLVCAASFELARARRVPLWARGTVVAVSGLVVALVSPSVVTRLQVVPALALAIVTGLLVLLGGVAALRAAHTRALGVILAMLAVAGLLRPIAWEALAIAQDRASMAAFTFGRVVGAFAVVLHALAVLVAATWVGTRDRAQGGASAGRGWRGRVLANAAIILGFVVTYLAARETEGAPLATFAVLRTALAHAPGASLPWGIGAIAQFLVPASVLLAVAALVSGARTKAVVVSLSLALLSSGAFDVPLQSLAIVASAEWALLAMADDRSIWETLAERRDHVAERPAAARPDARVAAPPSESAEG